MATVVSDVTTTAADGTTVETIVYSDGSKSIQVVPGSGTPAANQQTIQNRAQAALAANATFLALSAPTNAQTVAQVQALTKECTALIKLALGLLADTTGT